MNSFELHLFWKRKYTAAMRTTCSHGNYIVCTLCLMKTLQNIARLQSADKRNYSKYNNMQK